MKSANALTAVQVRRCREIIESGHDCGIPKHRREVLLRRND